MKSRYGDTDRRSATLLYHKSTQKQPMSIAQWRQTAEAHVGDASGESSLLYGRASTRSFRSISSYGSGDDGDLFLSADEQMSPQTSGSSDADSRVFAAFPRGMGGSSTELGLSPPSASSAEKKAMASPAPLTRVMLGENRSAATNRQDRHTAAFGSLDYETNALRGDSNNASGRTRSEASGWHLSHGVSQVSEELRQGQKPSTSSIASLRNLFE
eukprot:scaffold1900_cov389-Prasinococcus_capsulatus_cf.AAC.7